MCPATDLPAYEPSLIQRYDVPGPRYTSYPTAPQFRPDFGEAALREAAAVSNREPLPRQLSLYVHVPYCMSPCFYCGCNRLITRDITKADRYLERLFREIDLTGSLFDRDRAVRQLHFGGGTPNFLDLPRMAALVGRLAERFSLLSGQEREYGIELDPRYCGGDYVRGLGELGFNRVSVGIQDFDPDVQVAVNRIQSVAQTREVLDAARASGFTSCSVDLIYGLPRQTLAGFGRTLGEVIALAPHRIAVYGYAHLPDLFKAQSQIDAAELPDASTRLELFGLALRRLSEAGYVYVGMDHFARADDELVRAQRAGTLQRNFQGYSTHGDCDIVGLGVSAIGRVGDTYSQNERDLGAYFAAIDAGRLPVAKGLRLSQDDLMRRELIGELMCLGSVDMGAFGVRHGLDFPVYFDAELRRLAPLVKDGLVECDESMVRVTPRGRLLLRNIAMCFDAYLHAAAEPRRFSRAI
ncbi:MULTISPECIES: oxygen-independent coproporphyrinogen III oxidase [Dyella]|uniref:Coproporphyrinogen-III oxidase n=2 Tax=Dyella TaxID=231454 RepID=A0A4R0YYD7_9GAMM|nr:MULTISPECIES: oxygen-independent coproporphyrinogen III oxidase [Dyella]TBR40019.1 oxygen-independent coproporphyrinogen III oxidase [Dyella terrae]TCI12399.1 oxygen-independent coproporphyrinogen III oxidase [Dyella soli]